MGLCVGCEQRKTVGAIDLARSKKDSVLSLISRAPEMSRFSRYNRLPGIEVTGHELVLHKQGTFVYSIGVKS
jgi:hypothetical protein